MVICCQCWFFYWFLKGTLLPYQVKSIVSDQDFFISDHPHQTHSHAEWQDSLGLQRADFPFPFSFESMSHSVSEWSGASSLFWMKQNQWPFNFWRDCLSPCSTLKVWGTIPQNPTKEAADHLPFHFLVQVLLTWKSRPTPHSFLFRSWNILTNVFFIQFQSQVKAETTDASTQENIEKCDMMIQVDENELLRSTMYGAEYLLTTLKKCKWMV